MGRPSCRHHINIVGGSVNLEELDAIADGDHKKPPTYWLEPLPGSPPLTVMEMTEDAASDGRVADLAKHPLSDALKFHSTTEPPG